MESEGLGHTLGRAVCLEAPSTGGGSPPAPQMGQAAAPVTGSSQPKEGETPLAGRVQS